MALEDLLERIAVALEKSNELRAQHTVMVDAFAKEARKKRLDKESDTISQTLTDHPEVNSEPVEKNSSTRDYQKAAVEEAFKDKTATTEVDAKAKPEKEKPKYDFNKEIRQPFVELLNKTKDKHGAKDATRLGRKMLKEFTGQDVEVLSAKNLPEAKYEEFLAAVKEQRSYVLDDERYAGFDKD